MAEDRKIEELSNDSTVPKVSSHDGQGSGQVASSRAAACYDLRRIDPEAGSVLLALDFFC